MDEGHFPSQLWPASSSSYGIRHHPLPQRLTAHPPTAPVSGLTSEAAAGGGGLGGAAEKEELGVGGLEPMLVIAERSVLTPTQGRET